LGKEGIGLSRRHPQVEPITPLSDKKPEATFQRRERESKGKAQSKKLEIERPYIMHGNLERRFEEGNSKKGTGRRVGERRREQGK